MDGGKKRAREEPLGEGEPAKKSTAGPRAVALVTGASRGIGAAVARLLAGEGYAVAVGFCGGKEAAEAVVAGIRDAGGCASAFQADVGVEADVRRLFAAVDEAWPELPWKALVNNAGVLGDKGSLESFTAENYRKVFDTNVLGPTLCCQEFARRAGRGAAIVNVSSGSAVICQGPYGMSKAALNSMQAWLVPELGREGIRINTVSPGVTDTDMIASIKENFDMSIIPMGRFGMPEELADAVAFLLSERASYISGANLRVSGGRPPGTFIG